MVPSPRATYIQYSASLPPPPSPVPVPCRRRLGDEYQKQVLAVLSQWESDVQKSKDSEEKLQTMFKQQQKLFQQQRIVQSQRLKTIKQLHEQYTKVKGGECLSFPTFSFGPRCVVLSKGICILSIGGIMCPYTCIHAYTLTHTHSLSHTHTHTHTRALTHTTHTCALTLTHTCSLTLVHTHSLTHAITQGMDDLDHCHSEQQTNMQGELKKEMALLQKKILMETVRNTLVKK